MIRALDQPTLEEMKARLLAAMESHSEPAPEMLIPRPGCDRCRDTGSPGYVVQKRRSHAERDQLIDVLIKCECQRPVVVVEDALDAVRAAARGGRRRS